MVRYFLAAFCLLARGVAVHGDNVTLAPPPPERVGYVNGPGYNVVSVSGANTARMTFALSLASDNGDHKYGAYIKELAVEVWQNKDSVRVKISDKNARRWEVPTSLYGRGALGKQGDQPKQQQQQQQPNDTLYDFKHTTSPFSFQVVRKVDGFVLFDSSKLPLVVKDRYLQIATAVDDSLGIYGLGESTRDSMRMSVGDKHTLWARDQFAAEKDKNLYGAQPFYMGLTNKGKAHGVLLLNSNGMDVTLDKGFLVYQTLGGVLDFFVLVGESPAQVMNQYTALVGKPAMMPYWSFGFHQCRWGYENVAELREVVANYSKAKIPLDTMWSDIDYMNYYHDFTLDPKNYSAPEMKSYVEMLHKNNQHLVPIVDPGIPDDKQDPAYTDGLAMDVFIKTPRGDNYLGQVWPGPTVFPDFFNPNTTTYWTKHFDRFHNELLDYDGIWIDMNELANFCPGLVCSHDPTMNCPHLDDPNWKQYECCLKCEDDKNEWNNPEFAINNYGDHYPLYNKTISLDSLHYGGIREYDSHNLYGFMESIATESAVAAVLKKRPFVLSRSNFPGTGAYVAHWTGDNAATWNDLRWSIPSILNHGIFGIPMVGADICGFLEKSNEQLCARWTQLGAFYPFSRNHNNKGMPPQETYRWESVAAVGRKFIGKRYELLPYIYTTAFESHDTGAPIARALFYEFPEDVNTHVAPAVDSQFMLGRSILVSPVLVENATSVDAYMPKGVWYDLFSYTRLESDGKVVHFDAKLDEMPVHIRGGSIVPMQQSAMTSAEVAATPFTLVVALDKNGEASGELYLDDGEEIDAGAHSTLVKLSVQLDVKGTGVLKSEIVRNDFAGANTKQLGKIVVLGLGAKPTKAQVQSTTASRGTCGGDDGGVSVEKTLAVAFDEASRRAEIDASSLKLSIASQLSLTLQ